MEEKLRTLKDLNRIKEFQDINGNIAKMRKIYISEEELKAEAVKWVKKDKEDILKENSIITPIYLLKRWMRFFNLTEEDLGEKGK